LAAEGVAAGLESAFFSVLAVEDESVDAVELPDDESDDELVSLEDVVSFEEDELFEDDPRLSVL
jgi:hypothetical protein